MDKNEYWIPSREWKKELTFLVDKHDFRFFDEKMHVDMYKRRVKESHEESYV